jgi:trans-aconitate methyltransferase
VAQEWPPRDPWTDGGRYERYMGRWSRPVARRFLAWLGLPPGRHWLDVGCGTGALTGEILASGEPASVTGVDPSADFVAHAAARVADPRASFRVGSAQALPTADATADAVVSGLVLNFVPDQAAALTEMRRATRPGGVVAAYVWDYADGMQLIRRFWEAAAAVGAQVRDLEEGLRFTVCRPEPLAAVFHGAGLEDVTVQEIVVPTVFADFDDYWTPFLGGTGTAPSYAVSLEESKRTALREHLRASLPTEADGSVHLTARAWAVRGYSRSSHARS